MKIGNKKNYMYIRVIMIIMCIIILLLFFIAGIFSGLILLSIIIIFTSLAIFIKFTEFDSSGEFLFIRKYHILQSGYIRPKIEIPRIYVSDYSIEKGVWVYYLKILIDYGSSKERIKITLFGFNQFDIIKIKKNLEHITKENNYHEMRILSEPAFKSKFRYADYIIDLN